MKTKDFSKDAIALLMISICFVFFSVSLNAQVPQLINYQGKIAKLSGEPLDTTIQMVFSIYADAEGANLLWTETQTLVVVEKGIFNVLLGNVNLIPYSVFNGATRYLGVKVGADPEITPRKAIITVAYAYRSFEADTANFARVFSGTAENADKVDGLHASGTPTAGYLYPLDVSTKIPNARLYTGSGNGLDADLLDGQHASDFLTTANDYGRSGVATDLYEGTSTLTSKYVNEGQANSITTGMILDNTIVRTDVASNFKAPYSDTADYARVAAPDNDWTFRITDTADTTLVARGQWGIARYGNFLYGNADSTHVNLGISSATGTGGQNIKYCTVGGGVNNQAIGQYATVGGGWDNHASYGATVGGGEHNQATNAQATVAGGSGNIAGGSGAFVGGGWSNTASGGLATIGGGYQNKAEGGATIGGGQYDTASANATVGGGLKNVASSGFATVSGGDRNRASGSNATIGGGFLNVASGNYATIPGGRFNTAAGDHSFAAGNEVMLTSDADYTFAFGYKFITSASHAVIFYDSLSEMNVGIQTTSPTARLDVSGSTGYNQVRMRTSYTPTGTNDPNGNVGDIAWDDDYFYVKTSSGWKKAALSTW